jgi:hypothetical protein
LDYDEDDPENGWIDESNEDDNKAWHNKFTASVIPGSWNEVTVWQTNVENVDITFSNTYETPPPGWAVYIEPAELTIPTQSMAPMTVWIFVPYGYENTTIITHSTPIDYDGAYFEIPFYIYCI